MLQFDPSPRPVSTYAELWGKEAKTLNGWCAKGWVPGSFKHPSGEWFVNPIALINFSLPDEVTLEARSTRPNAKPFSRPARLPYEDDAN